MINRGSLLGMSDPKHSCNSLFFTGTYAGFDFVHNERKKGRKKT